MIIHGDQAFIVVNNSGKVYRTRAGDMEFLGKITGLISPRYVVLQETSTTGTIAYISDLYSGTITLADPVQGSVRDSIPIRKGSERRSSENLILHDDKLYVTCWSYGRQVLVFDTPTLRLIDSIEVGKQPNSMLMDPRGYLWVLSDGGYPHSPYGQEKASLTRIHPGNHLPERMKTWSDIRVSPTDLCIGKGGDSLYFIAGDIYKVSTEMEGFNKPLIPAGERQFYSLGVDPTDGTIYAGDAVDYQQDGWVYRFSSGGVPIDSFRVGVNPGFFCFFDPAQQ
jgi:DNA-binding beta-propeller fold protein YncE